MNAIALYVAAGLTALWGVAHLFATGGVVRGFGEITADNKRIITMEWIVEGVALLSIAAFTVSGTVTGSGASGPLPVFAVAMGTLIILAIVSLFTGFRVAFLPFRLCPLIFGASAALIVWGAWL